MMKNQMMLLVSMLTVCATYGQVFPDLEIHPGNGVTTNVAAIGGAVNVRVNPGTQGGGIVALSPASSYYGSTLLGCGTLAVELFADGGVASSVGASAAEPGNLVIDAGTLRYAGAPATANRGFTVTGPSAVFDIATSLTLTGQAQVENGCFFKTGAGTLFLGGTGTNYLPFASSPIRQDNVVNFKANGDAPTDGLASVAVLEGVLAWGVPGQTMIVQGTDVHIGGYTSDAAGGEKPGFLDIYGGSTYFNCWLAIGRHNGTLVTAPVPLESRVRVFDGTVQITHLTMGRNKKGYSKFKANSKPTLEVFGGSVKVTSTCRLGDDQGGDTVVRVLGGTFQSYPICLFGAMAGRSTNLLEIAGNGVFTAWEMNLAVVGADTDTTLNVHDGGVLSPYRIFAAKGETRLRFDGGILRPRFSSASAAVEASVGAVYLSTNGVLIDITAANSALAFDAPMLTAPDLAGAADGGLTLTGNANGVLDLGGENTYTGPTTVSNGILTVRGSLPAATPLTILPGGALAITNAAKTVTVGSLAIGAPGTPGSIDFHIGAAVGAAAKLVVTGAVTAHATPAFKLFLYQPGTFEGVIDDGTYTFLQLPAATAAAVDPVRFAIANPVSGKRYALVADTSGDDTFYRVTVSTGTAFGDVWVNAAGGSWQTGANWLGTTPPDAPFATAAFTTEAQAGGAVIDLTAPVTLGAASVASAAPYTFSGDTLTFDGGLAGATWEVTLGSHTLASPIALASPLALATVAGATQTLSGAVSAPQALTVNPAASGAGTVRFTGANALSGPFAVNSGTAAFEGADALAGLAAPVVGSGTLQYSGAAATLTGLTLWPDANRAAILKNDGDLTVTAPVRAVTGAFIKSGTGTLTLADPGSFAFGSTLSSMAHDFAGYPDNGDSPPTSFSALTVSQGRLAWGAAGQTLTVGNNLWIGTRTANGPGEAVTGEVEINGGDTTVNGTIYIGVANGDPVSAPVPMHPRLTLNSGTVTCSGGLYMGWDNRTTTAAYYGTDQAMNTHPELVINGGVLRLNGAFHPSYHGGIGSTNRVTLNGGELSARYVLFGASWFDTIPASTVLFEMNGGFLNLLEDFRTARYSADSYFYFNGGILRAWDIQKADGGGNSEVWLNGGVFQPINSGQTTVYRTFDRHTNVWVSAGGFIIDTSYLSDDAPAYEIAQAMQHDPDLGATPDGGIVKRGVSGRVILRPLAAGQRYAFTGPVTVEEGVLGIDRQALWENHVILHEGATLRHSNKDALQVVDALTAGTNSAGTGCVTLDLSFDATTSQSQPLVVSNALNIVADIEVVGHVDGGYTLILPVGNAVTVLVCNADQTLDPGKFRGSALFPNRTATFQKVTLSDGDYTGWQAIVMAVVDQAAIESAVWDAPSGGAWETSGNWLASAVPPSQVSQQALFANAASPAVPVTLADAKTLGQITLSTGSGLGYAFSGGALSLAEFGADTPKINVLSGTHAIAAPLHSDQNFWIDTRADAAVEVSGAVSGGGRLFVNADTSGGGTTVLSSANTHAGGTEIRSGTLRVSRIDALGDPVRTDNNLQVGPGTFHYTGPAASTDLGITFASGVAGKPAIIRLDNDLTLTGPASQSSGIFAKFGPGTLRLAYPGINTFTLSAAGNGNSTAVWPANGDGPAFGEGGGSRCFIDQGRFVVGGPGQTFIFNAELDIGAQDRGLGDNAHEASMDVIGGTVNINYYFTLGANFKRETGTDTFATLNVYDGDMTVKYFTMAYDVLWKAHSTKATLNVYGGSFTVAEQFRLGHHKGNAQNPPHATVNVYGGAVNHAHASEGTTFGWYNSGDPKPACSGTLNLFGGAFNERWLLKMANSDSIARLNLHGGVLRAENITHVSGSVGQSHLFFNGGVYMPLGTNAAQRTLQGLTSATVSTNGAVIDTSLAAAAITFAQRMTHDPELGSTPDGGLVKRGDAELVLAVSNAFTGPVAVESGMLRATVDGAVPDALHVAAGALFNADGATRTVPRVAGEGLLSNGTVRVTHEMSPGATIGTPAGAVLTFENLALGAGVVYVCNATANGLPFGTNDVIAVDNHLSVEGPGIIDLGRTEASPIVPPYAAIVMTYGTCDGSFAGWRVRGTGYPAGKFALRVTRDESGPVNVIRAELVQNGTVLTLR